MPGAGSGSGGERLANDGEVMLVRAILEGAMDDRWVCLDVYGIPLNSSCSPACRTNHLGDRPIFTYVEAERRVRIRSSSSALPASSSRTARRQ